MAVLSKFEPTNLIGIGKFVAWKIMEAPKIWWETPTKAKQQGFFVLLGIATSKFYVGSEIWFKMCGCTLAAHLLEIADLEASDCLEVLAADHFFFCLVTGFKVIVTLLCKDPFSTYLTNLGNLS